LGGDCWAYTLEQSVKAVIGEAENQGQVGMDAVACAISNRGTLSGVYGLHSFRVRKHLYSHSTYNKALKAVLRAKSPSYCTELIHGATGWGNNKDVESFKHTTWFPSVYFTAHIGDHWFYGTDG
jgi:hypothetical protein